MKKPILSKGFYSFIIAFSSIILLSIGLLVFVVQLNFGTSEGNVAAPLEGE